MTPSARLLLVLAMASCCGAVLVRWGASADQPAPRAVPGDGGERRGGAALTFEVVVEDVDVAGNTITARAYRHVIPPSGSTGGAVYSGHLPPGAKPSRYERLPVMPQAGLKNKGLRPGMRATLRMDTAEGAALVVVGIERADGPERVGVDWLDAPAHKAGR
jgi:hypothetical protein